MGGGNGRIRPADDLIRPAVAETLQNLPDDPTSARDAAARRLAMRYADQLDEAALIAADLEDVEVDEDNAQLLYALRKRVEAHQVLLDLGPKLLAVLESLGATPKGRAAMGYRPSTGGGGKLAALRGGK